MKTLAGVIIIILAATTLGLALTKNVAGSVVVGVVALILIFTSLDSHPSSTLQPPPNRDGYFQNKKGHWMYERTWGIGPGRTPLGVVILVHGFGEHLHRSGYAYLASKLNDAGYIVTGTEHQGHGRSYGFKGYITSFNSYAEDLLDFVEMKKQVYGGLPIFAFGHSMGGAITLIASNKRPGLFRGLVLSAPLIKLDDSKLTTFNKLAAPVLSALIPKGLFPESLDPAHMSRSPSAVEEYIKDPMIQKGWVRVRTAAEILSATEMLQETISTFTTPFLVIHGDNDHVVDIKGSKQLMNMGGAADKTFIPMAGVYHEVFEDRDRELYVDKVIDWLRVRTGTSIVSSKDEATVLLSISDDIGESKF